MPSHVFSIAPALPFLPTLARGVLDGRFLPGEDFSADPLALAGLTILVPTRRAARSLAGEFARAMGGGSAILPSIRTLAEADEGRPSSISALRWRRRWTLLERISCSRLVRFWKDGLNRQALRLLANEEIVLPASAADALYSAEDLCAFLDER